MTDEHRTILSQWTRQVGGMAPNLHVGRRFPPPFVALLCDFVTPWLDGHDHVEPMEEALSHPLQAFTVWVRFGFIEPPTMEQITAGWSPTHREVLSSVP